MTLTAEIDESPWRRRLRRCVTIPAYLGTALVLVTLLPALVPVAALVDVVRGNPQLVTLRCLAALTLYFVCEAAGVLMAAVVWLASGVWAGGDRQRYLSWNYALQRQWARVLFAGAARCFTLRLRVEGADQIARGPFLLLARHASTVDTLLPAVFVANAHRLRLRYVMKRELLWDPCLDVVGLRLPNVFVRRGSDDSAREIAAVGRLARDLRPGEGVLIFPEGTRFTPAKRTRVLARLAQAGDAARWQRAQALAHVLPPRTGGVLALLEAQPAADVVFLAHVGFDGVGSLNDLWNGALVGRTIRLLFWRVPRHEIPSERDACVAWLDAQWARIDSWIASLLPPETAGVVVPAALQRS